MTEYQGQPDYVIVGYLCDLFGPWSDIEGSEWGDLMGSIQRLLEACISVSDEKKAAVLCGWFLDEMNAAFENDWWDNQEYYEEDIYRAQDQYDHITTYWRERAVTFKGEAALEYCISRLPDWIRPAPDRPEKPDPELAMYEKLKAKFG